VFVEQTEKVGIIDRRHARCEPCRGATGSHFDGAEEGPRDPIAPENHRFDLSLLQQRLEPGIGHVNRYRTTVGLLQERESDEQREPDKYPLRQAGGRHLRRSAHRIPVAKA